MAGPRPGSGTGRERPLQLKLSALCLVAPGPHVPGRLNKAMPMHHSSAPVARSWCHDPYPPQQDFACSPTCLATVCFMAGRVLPPTLDRSQLRCPGHFRDRNALGNWSSTWMGMGMPCLWKVCCAAVWSTWTILRYQFGRCAPAYPGRCMAKPLYMCC